MSQTQAEKVLLKNFENAWPYMYFIYPNIVRNVCNSIKIPLAQYILKHILFQANQFQRKPITTGEIMAYLFLQVYTNPLLYLLHMHLTKCMKFKEIWRLVASCN